MSVSREDIKKGMKQDAAAAPHLCRNKMPLSALLRSNRA